MVGIIEWLGKKRSKDQFIELGGTNKQKITRRKKQMKKKHKNKKNKDTMTNIALGGIMSTVVVGSVPSTSASAGITAGYTTGMGNIGSKLPVMGKIKGSIMVLNSLGSLKKPLKKLKKKSKGGKNL